MQIRVLPFGIELPTLSHGFWIYDETKVCIETMAAEIVVREEVALYTRLFDQLWQASASGDEACSLIVRASEPLKSSTDLLTTQTSTLRRLIGRIHFPAED